MTRIWMVGKVIVLEIIMEVAHSFIVMSWEYVVHLLWHQVRRLVIGLRHLVLSLNGSSVGAEVLIEAHLEA